MKSPIHPINFLFITLFLLMSVTAQSQTVLVDGSVFLSDQALHGNPWFMGLITWCRKNNLYIE
jgi:hypothetical protein